MFTVFCDYKGMSQTDLAHKLLKTLSRPFKVSHSAILPSSVPF